MLGKLAFIGAVLAANTALAGGPRMKFEVPEPFQVGSHHGGAGTIAVRSVGVTTTPVALIEIWVDGSCIGALQASRDLDGLARRDEALFQRDEDGRLVMVGFRVAGDRDGTYRFAEGGLIPSGSPLAEARTPTSRR